MVAKKVLINLLKRILNNAQMKKICCITCVNYTKFKECTTSYVWSKALVFFSCCKKRGCNNDKILKEEQTF